MYEFKKNGKVFTSKSVGNGPSSYEKSVYRAAVSQIFEKHWSSGSLHLLSLLPTTSSFYQFRRRDNFIYVLYTAMRGSVWRYIARVAMKIITLIHINGYVS